MIVLSRSEPGRLPAHEFQEITISFNGEIYNFKEVRAELEEKIEWKGAYHRDQIPAIIQNAELLVLPRPDSKQAQGGFPTKLGEYLATGNPVVATSVGELPDYLKDGKSVFFSKSGSVDSFVGSMRRALSNPAEAKQIGANGRQVAQKHFNKDIQANELFDFIKALENDL